MYPYTTYPTAYQQAFQNPYINQFQQPQAAQKCEIIKVNGRGGAEAFQMAANSSILLLDETQPLVWLKATDGAGYPVITPYSITPYQPEPPVDTKSLEARVSRIEEMLNNEQSNSRSVKRKTAANTEPTANQANDEPNA